MFRDRGIIIINKSNMNRNCDHCGKKYEADIRNVNRGWGLCCSKSCAAKKRESGKLTTGQIENSALFQILENMSPDLRYATINNCCEYFGYSLQKTKKPA